MSNTFDDAMAAFSSDLPEDLPEVPVVPDENQPPEADAPDVDESQPEPEGPASNEIDISQLPEEAQIFLRAREREMQRDYTRKTQEAARLREESQQYMDFVNALNSDPEFAVQVLNRLENQLSAAGFIEAAAQEEDFYDPEGYGDDGSDPYSAELEDLRSWRDRVESEWEQARAEAELNRQIAEIRSHHPEYTDQDVEDIYALGFYTDGDLRAANEMFRGIMDRSLSRYIEGKKSVQAPSPVRGGPGMPVPDDLREADDATLRAAAMERFRQAIGDSGLEG